MLKFSTYFYLMVLAVADTLVLYIGLLRLWIGQLTGYDLRDKSDWLCKATNVVGYTVSDFSVWLIIAVTIERYIVVCHPLKANSICDTRRAKRFILLLLLSFFAVNFHFFWTVQIVQYSFQDEKIPLCAGAPNHATLVEEAWPWVDAALYSFVPFAAITVLNTLIIRQVMHARRRRNTMQVKSHEVRTGDNRYEHRRPSHEGSTRLTVMLLTISFAFLLTTLPMNVINIAIGVLNRYSYGNHRAARFQLARTITELLMYMNHSMNFFLYCATGQKFRHQLIWMLCYSKRRLYAQQHRAQLQHQMQTQHTTWHSEGSHNQTRLDNARLDPMPIGHNAVNGSRNNLRRHGDNQTATIKSEMYTPLKHSS